MLRGGVRGGLHNQICSLDNLLLAWERFRKGKRSRTDVMVFEHALEDNLFTLHEELVTGNYEHGSYEPFTIYDPKQRTIHKAQVRDRVVHQAIVNVIEPFFDRRFIHDSFSCRIGKGTHAGIKRLQMFLRQASKNDHRTVYVLKCDIRKFFASVDQQTLLRLFAKRIQEAETMRLLSKIVGSFSTTSGKGIPLGNLTSQLFANVYLHELDWYVKQKLRVRHYVRYCDDFVLVVKTRTEAYLLACILEQFLYDKLGVHLHPNKIHVRAWTQGIDFLGYVLLPKAIIIRPKTVRRMLRNVTSDNISSYLGVCSHAQAYEISMMLLNKAGYARVSAP